MNAPTVNPPFDWRKLDRLMEERDIDVLLVSSKQNLQYLLDGYRFFFFDVADAIGISRYLPILVYPRGRPERAAYIGNVMESYEQENGRFWMPTVVPKAWGTQDAMRQALEQIATLDRPPRRIGIESAFLPADAFQVLQAGVENATIVDALVPLERLRAIKTKQELHTLREASERVVAAMAAVIGSATAGMTTREMAEALKREEQSRDLVFEYCLVTSGTRFNRAPSDVRWHRGEIASLDSGGNYHGYIGDLCRMAIMGTPDQELNDLLAGIDAVQMAARKPIRPGAIGKEIFAEAGKVLAKDPNRDHTGFVAHGMGIVSHEAPRLTSRAPVPYPGDDENLPLVEGMVISIETTLLHPTRGFIKLEDTVAVTASGCEGYGDSSRGWNVAGG